MRAVPLSKGLRKEKASTAVHSVQSASCSTPFTAHVEKLWHSLRNRGQIGRSFGHSRHGPQ